MQHKTMSGFPLQSLDIATCGKHRVWQSVLRWLISYDTWAVLPIYRGSTSKGSAIYTGEAVVETITVIMCCQPQAGRCHKNVSPTTNHLIYANTPQNLKFKPSTHRYKLQIALPALHWQQTHPHPYTWLHTASHKQSTQTIIIDKQCWGDHQVG